MCNALHHSNRNPSLNALRKNLQLRRLEKENFYTFECIPRKKASIFAQKK